MAASDIKKPGCVDICRPETYETRAQKWLARQEDAEEVGRAPPLLNKQTLNTKLPEHTYCDLEYAIRSTGETTSRETSKMRRAGLRLLLSEHNAVARASRYRCYNNA